MNVKILVCCHKLGVLPTGTSYLNIHVGASSSTSNLNIQRDDEGENISNKNKNYCELTGMYWAWKNLDCDYVGLCHYRRYFNLDSWISNNREAIHVEEDEFPIVRTDVIERIFKSSDIILPGKLYLSMSVGDAYCVSHSAIDLNITKDVIKELYPDYFESFDFIMNKSNSYSPCNMFIMNKKEFDKYCKWLFDILFEVEKRVCLSNYDSRQQRIFGFLSERLFNVYVHHQRFKIVYRPMVSMVAKKKVSRAYALAHRIKSSICFWLR